jgi:hypothetical protein
LEYLSFVLSRVDLIPLSALLTDLFFLVCNSFGTFSKAVERRSGREKKESARIKEAKDDDWVNKLIRVERGPYERRYRPKADSPLSNLPDSQMQSLHIPLEHAHLLPRSHPLAVPQRPSSAPTDFDPHASLSPSSRGERRRNTPRKIDPDASYNTSPRFKRQLPFGSLDKSPYSSPTPFEDSVPLSPKPISGELIPSASNALFEDPLEENNAVWIGEGSVWPPAYCANVLGPSADVRHYYPAISIGTVEYQLFDHVILRPLDEGVIEGIARIVALFEESSRKFLFVEWYYRKPDVLSHLTLMKALEDMLRNPVPVDGDDANGERRQVRRGRPPKKRRGNIEESLQILENALECEIWNTPKPHYSAVATSSIRAPCFVEHIPHHVVLPFIVGESEQASSPGEPIRFIYRKSYDPRTCYMPCSKPRSVISSPAATIPTTSTASSTSTTASTTGSLSQSSAASLQHSYTHQGNPTTTTIISSKAATMPIMPSSYYYSSPSAVAAAAAASSSSTSSTVRGPRLPTRSESFGSLPGASWFLETETLSPRSKIRKTTEVDQLAIHRHTVLSQSADGNFGHHQHHPMMGGGTTASGFEPMDVTSSEDRGQHQQHYYQPQQQQHVTTMHFTNQPAQFNSPVVWGSSHHHQQHQQHQVHYQQHQLHSATSPREAYLEAENAALRAKLDQMNDLAANMQQTINDLQETVNILQGAPPMTAYTPSASLHGPQQTQNLVHPVFVTRRPSIEFASHMPATANFSTIDQTESIIPTHELKEESYESPIDDFSVSSDTVAPNSARLMTVHPSSVPLAQDRTMNNIPTTYIVNPDFASSAVRSEFVVDHFFVPEHVGAQ